jgi:hypothetical protein
LTSAGQTSHRACEWHRAKEHIVRLRRVFCVLSAAAALAGAAPAPTAIGPLPRASFEPNLGQADPAVVFVGRAPGYTLLLEKGGAATYALASAKASEAQPVHMELLGSQAARLGAAEERLSSVGRVYRGADPARWLTEIPLYGRVRYAQVYPGVDLLYQGRQDREIEFSFALAPGADPAAIRLRFGGVRRVWIDTRGRLALETPSGTLRYRRPVAYQESGGSRRLVAASYRLSGGVVGFRLGPYRREDRLVIDPVLSFSSLLGGTQFDAIYAAAGDSAGNTYLTGTTFSSDFPLGPGGVRSSRSNRDVFITKIAYGAGGASVVYTTILRSSGNDAGNGIAVDAAGNVFVAGVAGAGFPVTSGAAQRTFGGLQDAFIVRLDASGSLAYSTYLGGGGSDTATGIALDYAGNAYVSGYTTSVQFPTTPGAPQTSFHGGTDAFLAKYSAAGSLLYSTLLGGSGTDLARSVAVTPSGRPCIAGYTDSADLPVQNALQPVKAGQGDALVACLSPGGSTWDYVTYLGGRGPDDAYAIAESASGNAYVTGATYSDDFPVTAGAFQTVRRGDYDAYVVKLAPTGNARVYSTLVGGSGSDTGMALAVDFSGQVWGAGATSSLDLPVRNAWQAANQGGLDGFVFRLSVDGKSLLDLSYLGGAADDQVSGLVIQGFGAVLVCGSSLSSDFPATAGALPAPAASYNGFFSRITAPAPVAVYRMFNNGIQALAFDSVTPSTALGLTQGDPGAAQNAAGDTFVFARDLQNGLWTNVYLSAGQRWKGWVSAGASSPGTPGVAAAPDGTAWVAIRDSAGSFWLRSYRTDTGFGAWINLGGAFNSDPAITVATDGSIYVVGAGLAPNQGQVSSGRYVPGSGFGGWVVGTTTATGRPAVAAGSDGAVYVEVRYADGTCGMSRLSGNTWGTWYTTPKAMSTDPQLAATGGRIYAVGLDAQNHAYVNAFQEGSGNGWFGWADAYGRVTTVAIAALRGEFYLVARDSNADIWWYRSGVGWIYYGSRAQSLSNFAAAPR